jgi:hypothetical protein
MVERGSAMEKEACVGGGCGFAVDLISNNLNKRLDKQKKKKKKEVAKRR